MLVHNWFVALLLFGAISIGVAAQGWMSWLEHKRRSQALDVIKVALQAGREPPPQLYDELRAGAQPKPPWTEVVLFGALAFGFWFAFANADGDRRVAFLVIAATMTATSLGCLGLALMRPGAPKAPDDDEQ